MELAFSKVAAPLKSRALVLIRARTIRASAPAVVLGKSDSILATASSDGHTPPRVIERKDSRAFISAAVCCRLRQLALKKSGTTATMSAAIPATRYAKRCLRRLIIEVFSNQLMHQLVTNNQSMQSRIIGLHY